MSRSPITFILSLLVAVLSLLLDSHAKEVSFRRDILPILSDKCFSCHGPDESQREADLRLDLEATAKDTDYEAIVPGNAAASSLIQRITSEDASELMPPPESHRARLTDAQVSLFQAWIDQGAVWQKHWAFEMPIREPLERKLAPHPIDYFVEKRRREVGLEASAPAPWPTLARRVALDLHGITPDSQLAQELIENPSELRYQQFVDELLSSPQFGQRMAMWWLDSARYADTDGYQQDATRNNWPWRDWVVDAFNQNMPFDQFTTEQFAGDLLPEATQEQILATCFHRNHMSNGEGGRHPEESRVDYVIDRVNTTGTVWLGLTIGCAQCHTHKFDPISQHDYYRLSAFFNSIDEDGKAGAGAKPFLQYKSQAAERAVSDAASVVAARRPVLEIAQASAEQEFENWLERERKSLAKEFRTWTPLTDTKLRSVEGTQFVQDQSGEIQTFGPLPFQDDYWITLKASNTNGERITGFRLDVLPHESHTDGKLSRGKTGEFILTDVKCQLRTSGQSQVQDIEIASAVADVEKKASGRNYGKIRDTLDDDPRNGWTTESHNPLESHSAIFVLRDPLVLAKNEELTFVLLQRSTYGDSNIGRFRISVTSEPAFALDSMEATPLTSLAKLRNQDNSELPSKLRQRLLQQYLSEHAGYQDAKRQLDAAQQQFSSFKKAAGSVAVTVLQQRESARKSHVLVRGVWDQHGDEVDAGVPAAIMPLESQEHASRLDLASWLVSPDNPLTARVIVNQLWQICFTKGLVRTPEDFGLQGEQPTHPELLDWLAVEFMESGWDVKHILRLMVTSQTYRQSSFDADQSLQEVDPENRYLARMTRSRLPAWMIRDNALQSSGLLNPALGGPPIRPYQPDGVWAEMFMGRFRYQPSQGSAQFRRTLYAFWRRSAAPTFLFDSSQRRVCEVRPRLTNTPLHALTLLNDLSLLEASRALAKTACQELAWQDETGFDDTKAKAAIRLLYRCILGRGPEAQELSVLLASHQTAFNTYAGSPGQAKSFLDFGQPENKVDDNIVPVAACTVMASLIFNLDEAITRE